MAISSSLFPPSSDDQEVKTVQLPMLQSVKAKYPGTEEALKLLRSSTWPWLVAHLRPSNTIHAPLVDVLAVDLHIIVYNMC